MARKGHEILLGEHEYATKTLLLRPAASAKPHARTTQEQQQAKQSLIVMLGLVIDTSIYTLWRGIHSQRHNVPSVDMAI